jgi:RNA polymerase sigma-70 factor (sigma-E family)
MSEGEDFERFVHARANALMRYGYLLTGNGDDAADLVQETLIRLRGAWRRVNHIEAIDAYARTTMARQYIRLWRRRRREHPVERIPERAVIDEGFERVADEGEIWQALCTLPRRQRAVLVLRYYEGLTDLEIAETLAIARGTVRSQAARGLKKLRVHLGPEPAASTAGARR